MRGHRQTLNTLLLLYLLEILGSQIMLATVLRCLNQKFHFIAPMEHWTQFQCLGKHSLTQVHLVQMRVALLLFLLSIVVMKALTLELQIRITLIRYLISLAQEK